MRVLSAAALSVALTACATSTVDTSAVTVEEVDASASNSIVASTIKPDLNTYQPPKPGTALSYLSTYKDEDDAELLQIVVATGEDYAVFANILDDGLSGPADLFIEYSGLYWQDCSLPPISDYQREKLAALWPLEQGDTASMPYQGDLSSQMTIEVRGWTTVEVSGVGEVDAVEILNSYEEKDMSTFSPELGYAVRVDWGDPATPEHLGYDVLTGVSTVDLDDYAAYVSLAAQACVN